MPDVDLIRTVKDSKDRSICEFSPRGDPASVLFCPPDYFDIVDVKNAYMANQVGKVEKAKARRQWQAIRAAVIETDRSVHEIRPVQGLEDMVFAANPVFIGLGVQGEKLCLLSNMKHPSRRKEVPVYGKWFGDRGYKVVRLSNPDWSFEGHGDALWHPARRLIWGGYGFRSVPEVYEEVAKIYSSPVVLLELKHEHFYHLDTCLCPLSEKEALYFPGAFSNTGKELVTKLFSAAIEVSEIEAREGFACNAWPLGKKVLIQRGNPKTVQALRDHGYEPVEVDTSEFMKSGGSVFCMKSMVY